MSVVIVEHFEHRYGYEENRFFGVFSSLAAFHEYCEENSITVSLIDDNFGCRYSYYNDEFSYQVKEVEFIK